MTFVMDRAGGRFGLGSRRPASRAGLFDFRFHDLRHTAASHLVMRGRPLNEIQEILDQLHRWNPPDVLLMPEGIDAETLNERAAWISEICKREGFRFCPRLHVQLYGNKRGT